MTKSTHKLPKLLLRPVIKVVMFALLLCFGSGAALAQTRAYVTNNHEQYCLGDRYGDLFSNRHRTRWIESSRR